MEDPMIFQFIGTSITNGMDAYVNSTVPAVIGKITATAVLATTVYYSYIGYLTMLGRIPGSISHIMISAAKFAIIATFALSAGFYLQYVAGGVRDLETGLTQAFAGQQGTAPENVYAMVDESVRQGWTLSGELWESAGNRGMTEMGMMFGEYLNAIIIAVATMIIAIPGGAMIVVAKTLMELLLGIGPLFIMCLMWSPTRGFFDRWFGSIMTTVLTIALIGAVLAFALKMFSIVVSATDINSSSDSPFFGALRLGAITLVMLFLLYEVKSHAAGLAGGMASAAITLGQMVAGTARGLTAPGTLAQSIFNPVSTRRDLQSGMMSTAGRLNHLAAGNTMWNPAYRQHVLQNMGRNWGRATGGTVRG